MPIETKQQMICLDELVLGLDTKKLFLKLIQLPELERALAGAPKAYPSLLSLLVTRPQPMLLGYRFQKSASST